MSSIAANQTDFSPPPYGLSALRSLHWLHANVDAVVCDCARMEAVFDRCMGSPLSG